MMFPIDITYKLTLRDYRMAVYFAKLQQNLFSFRIMVGAFTVTLLYYLVSLVTELSFSMALWLLPGSYLVWTLLVLGKLELGIQRYLKSPDCMIGVEFRAIFSDQAMEIRIPSQKTTNHCMYARLAMILEITDLYMIYLDGSHTFLVSKKPLTPEQKTLLRETFRKRAGKQFFTTYGKRRPESGGFRLFQKKP